MKTNHLMLRELLENYHPAQRGIINYVERELVKKTLCINEMDILQLRNLRDFTVSYLGRSDKMEDWDRMSAITYVIDSALAILGEEV